MRKARQGSHVFIFFTFIFILLFSSELYAKTRIKTVEWSFGSYFNSSDLTSGAIWTAPTITVSLPESGKTIKNAFLELECWTYGTSDVSNVDIRFDQGSSASTIRDVVTSDYSNNTGEHLRIFALADVTAAISTNASQTYTASVSVTGSPTNSHSLKLYITYEYDSTSETQVKTVRFLLRSAADFGSRSAAASENSTYSYSYNAAIADSGVSVKQQWFEIRGLKSWGGRNNITGNMSVNIVGGSVSDAFNLDCIEETSYDYRMINSASVTDGFNLNTNQTLNINLSNNRGRPEPTHYMMGGECVVTIEYSASSSSKTKSVRIFLGQDESADTAANFTKPLTLGESGVSIREIYAELTGSYNVNSENNIVINSSVNAQNIPAASYYLMAYTPNTSGFIIYHDLGNKKDSWTDGSDIGLGIGALTGLGGCGANLIVTYDYEDETVFTEFYQAWTGQSATGNLTSTSQTYDLFFPDPETPAGSKTLFSNFLWLYFNHNDNANDATTDINPVTTINIGGTNQIAVQHRTQNECHSGYVFYGAEQITTSTTSATLNFSISNEVASLSGKYFNTYKYAPPADPPANLAQFESDGITAIAVGGWINSGSVVLKFDMNSVLEDDTLTPQFELRPVGTDFTNTPTHSGTAQSFTGTVITGSATVTGLAGGNTYHWQARISATGGDSAWVSFGNNLETESDFGVDTTSPTAPVLVSPADVLITSSTAFSFSWNASTEEHSGLDYYELVISSESGFESVYVSSETSITSVYLTGFEENEYYWKVRAFDNVGNTGDYSLSRSFNVDLSSPTVADNQSGETFWRKYNTGEYDVSFYDTGGAGLDKFQVRASTNPGNTGPFLAGWTDVITGINADSYELLWGLPEPVWEALLTDNTNYISVLVWDLANNSSTYADVFAILKDTTPPSYAIGAILVGGDDIWRKSGGTLYDVDFEDFSSGLSGAKYEVWTLPGGSSGGGVQKKALTSIPGVSGTSFTADWAIDFEALRDEAVNYVSIEIYDVAGNTTTVTDAFFVKKDTTPPSHIIGAPLTGGDNTWRKAGGTLYDVDFVDNGSALAGAKYEAWTLPGKASGGGVQRVAPTAIPEVSGSLFDTDWEVNFELLRDEWTNYVSIEIYDIAGNTRTITDAFFVKKDTTPPSYINGVFGGDNTWRRESGTTYNFNFSDNGSALSGAKYQAWSLEGGPSGGGTEIKTLTEIPGVSGSSYNTPWQVDFGALLESATNYISVEFYDAASNTTTVTDAFFVMKDTTPPYIVNNQLGDDMEHESDPGAIFDVDFFDHYGSRLKDIYYSIHRFPGYGEPVLKNWTPIALSVGATFYTDDWGIDFGACLEGYNYVSVRAVDLAGNTSNYADAFYVRKAGGLPVINYTPGEDYTWRNSSGTLYDVTFSSNSEIYPLGYFQTKACYLTNQQGLIQDWATVVSDINEPEYNEPWALLEETWELLLPGTNYISIKVYDTENHSTTVSDVFVVLKDTQNPSGTATAAPYSNSPDFDVSFVASDSGHSGLDYVKLFYTTDNAQPYNWAQFGDTFSASPINFTGAVEDTYGFKIVAYDRAGNTDDSDPPENSDPPESSCVVDLSTPTFTNNESGGDVAWRTDGGTAYDVRFYDTGDSKLHTAQYAVYPFQGLSGDLIIGWTDIVTEIGLNSYEIPWGVDYDNLELGTSNYVSVRVWDYAGNYDILQDAFFIKKDNAAPEISGLPEGDDVYRNSGVSYSPVFTDAHSKLSAVFYAANTGALQSGTTVIDWSPIEEAIGEESYSLPWEVDFELLEDGANFISLRAVDIAGNTSNYIDAFYILKDTQAPNIQNNEAGGDLVWRTENKPGGYDVNFFDEGFSGIHTVQYAANTGALQSGTTVIDWTTVESEINAPSYEDNLILTFNLLADEATNYISVRAWDVAGTTATLVDAFRILKDTAGPVIDNNQSGDEEWRSVNDAFYDISFKDPASGIEYFETVVYSLSGGGGVLLDGPRTVLTVNATYYDTSWQIANETFDAMNNGTNFVTINAYSVSGALSTEQDAFYVKKDTVAPTIDNPLYESGGDDVWRSSNTGNYNITFNDELSLLERVRYSGWTGPGKTGSNPVGWSEIASGINSAGYNSDWQLSGADFELLLSGTNYITVDALDNAGNTAELVDAFYVRKDTTPPAAIANLSASAGGSEGEIDISWTAPGDDSNAGRAESYEIRYALFQATGENFGSMSLLEHSLSPAPAGTPESLTVTGLVSDTTYYFAIITADKAGNESIISNLTGNFARSGPDVTPPNDIIDLSAQEGFNAGQIILTWTAPGDNGTEGDIPPPGYYDFRYRTDTAVTDANWNSSTGVTGPPFPGPAGSEESFTVYGLSAGVTYYFAVKTYDEAFNASGLSNSAYSPAGLAGPSSGLIVYGELTNLQPTYRSYNPPDFSDASAGVTAAATQRWLVLKENPIFNEKMLGILSSDGTLTVQRWSGSSFEANEWSSSGITAANSAYRGFDIAYEDSTGRSLVVYYNNSTGSISYRVWSASTTAWVVGQTANALTGLTGTIYWVKLTPKRNSSEIMLTVLDSNSNVYSKLWNGSIWVDSTAYTIATDATLSSMEVFSADWESLSGRCLVAYGGASNMSSAIFDGSSWTAGPGYALGSNARVRAVSLKADPNSNRMGFTTATNRGTWVVALWNGSGWTAGPTTDSNVGTITPYLTDAAWERKSEKLLIVCGDQNSRFIDYVTWQNNAWSVASLDNAAEDTQNWSGVIHSLNLISDPNTNNIMAVGSDVNGELRTRLWNYSSNSFTGGAVMNSTALSSVAHAPFMFSFDRYDAEAPVIVDNQTGDDTWRNANTGFYKVYFEDYGISGLSYFQIKAMTGPNQTGNLVLDWTTQVSDINASEYTTDWQLTNETFDALYQGVNFISVRVFDMAGNQQSLTDAFYVRKDTVPPAAINNLSVTSNGLQNRVALSWTAPGDNGTSETITSGYYIVKYHDSAIDDANWDAAVTFSTNWVPRAPGQTESRSITGLAAGVTYYVAIKTVDKTSNVSGISNSGFAVAQSLGIFINEIYSGGSAAEDDWIELINTHGYPINLAGYTIMYNDGSIQEPGTNQLVWTGGVADALASSGTVLIIPSVNLGTAGGRHLRLFDNVPLEIESVQWPALSPGESFARVESIPGLYEITAAPTKGYRNSITTGTVKINEVLYDSGVEEFIELYNDSGEEKSLVNWRIRSSQGAVFVFSRVVKPYGFAVIDATSHDNYGNSYLSVFGAGGLNKTSDFIVLENESGQAVDRLGWQYENSYVYYNSQGVPVFADTLSTGNLSAPASLGRWPVDGFDTDRDISDFKVFDIHSYASHNNKPETASPNTVFQPSTNALAKNFKLEFSFGSDSSAGSNNILIFKRTGGAEDQHSPHIYRLADLGFDPSVLAMQATVQTGLSMNDQNARALVGGAIYDMMFMSDTLGAKAPVITFTGIFYDVSEHSVDVSTTAPKYMNVSSRDDLLKLTVISNSPLNANNLELGGVSVKFTDSESNPLTTAQARALFNSIFIARDGSSGISGIYESALDTEIVAVVENEYISLDAEGRQILPALDDIGNIPVVDAAGLQVFYVCVELKSGAHLETPNAFKVFIEAGSDVTLNDAPSGVAQDLTSAEEKATILVTALLPAPPPIGTSWPLAVSAGQAVSGINTGDAGDDVYLASGDGRLYAVKNDGTGQKWSFNAGSPLSAAPITMEIDGNEHIIFATSGGDVYNVRDDAAEGAQIWKKTLSDSVENITIWFDGGSDYVFASCLDGMIYKMDILNGNFDLNWDSDPSIAGTGSLYEFAIDNYTEGVNGLWVGSSNGRVYRLVYSGIGAGTRTSDFITGGAVMTSPVLAAGYIADPSKNTHNMYIPSEDGKLYCRSSSNLNNIPSGWSGLSNGAFDAGSPITSGVWLDLDGMIYFGTQDGQLYKLDGSNGTVEGGWPYRAGGAIYSGPVYFNGYIYFGSDDGYMYCLDANTVQLREGWPIWTGGAIRSQPVVDNDSGNIYFTSSDGKVYCIDIQ